MAALSTLGSRVEDVTERVLAAQAAVRSLEDEVGRARSTDAKSEEPSADRDASGEWPPQGDSTATAERLVAELEQRLSELESGAGNLGEQESALARSQRLYREGDALYRGGDWAGAAAVLREALDVNSSDYPSALVELGEALWQQKLWAAAIPFFKRAVSRPSPASQQALLRAMDCAWRLGRYAEAADTLTAALQAWGVEKVPPEAMYLGGKAAYRRTDLSATTRDSQALGFFHATRPPFDLAATYYRGAIHLRAGHVEEAVTEFQACDRILASDERQRAQREMCWLALGRLYSAQNLTESAFWYGQVPTESPRLTEALYEWAYTYEKDDLHEPALLPLARIPDPSPESALAPDIHLLRGTVLLHVRRYDDAVEAYGEVKRIYEPPAKELDRLLDADRDPVHYLDRLASARGRAIEGAAPAPLPPILLAWEKASSDIDGALDVIDDIEVAQRIAGNAQTLVARVQLDLSRGVDMRLFPDLEARYEHSKALSAAAFRLGARLAAPVPGSPDQGLDANQLAALQIRVGAVLARAEREQRELPTAARARAAALRARAASEGGKLDRAAAELVTLRSEARELAARLSYGSFQDMRTRLHYVLLAADRGTAQVALARSGGAQHRTQALLFRRIVERTIAMSPQRRAAMTEEYGRQSRAVQAEDRLRRDDAIAKLEAYVRDHPDDPLFTPEALARLGELQYLKANEDRSPEEPGQDPPAALPPGAAARPEPRGCAATVSLYEHLATEFPRYQQGDSAYFLLGYCLGEMGRTADAIRVYGDLVRKFPESSYVTEAEVRIGDLSFEEAKPESLRRALDAYSTLNAWPDDPFYVHALYMLGWTHYRSGDLDRAIDAFTRLLDRYVAKAPDGRPSGDEWGEALRQLVACFAEPRWDGQKRAQEWFDKHGARTYEADLFFRLGEGLFDQARYPAAVEAYKRFIARAPLSPEAPRAQAKIVTAWSRENRSQEEIKEREVLLSTYDESGAWWRKNGGDADLAKEVRSLREASLYSTATIHLATAQALKKAGQSQAAVAEYQRAEKGFSRYLQSSPSANVSGDVLFAWADSAYHSEDYRRAAELYERARDDAGTKSQKDAALNAVLSWSAELARARRAGELKGLPAQERAAGGAEPLPAPAAGLVRSSDALVERFPDHPRAPAVAYQAAEVTSQFGQVEEGHRRLEEVVRRWPDAGAAREAVTASVERPLAEKDWAAAEAAAKRMAGALGDRNPELAMQLRDVQERARFQRALALMEQKRWDEAAQLFAAVAAEAPKAESADKALFNAGICRQSQNRLDLSVAPYEQLVSQHPASPLAEEALFRLAQYAGSAYQPEKALSYFQLFLERYPKSSRRGDAFFGSGLSLEYLGRYDAAARSFTRYAEASPTARDAPDAILRAALLRERTRDWAGALQALEPFEKRSAKSGDRRLLVEAYARMGVAEERLGRGAAAKKHYAQAVDEFARQRLDPLTQVAAAAAAAEARFKLAEDDLERYEHLSLPAGNGRRIEKALGDKLAAMKKLTASYEAVKAFRRPDWTLAASYREGYVLEGFARSIADAPIPPELKLRGQEAYLAAYTAQLAQVARPYQEQALEAYAKTVQEARDFLVRSEWAARASAALTRIRPREYPRQREARWQPVADSFAPAPGGRGEASARVDVLRARLDAAPGDAATWRGLAAALVAAGRLGEAEDLAREAIRADKGNVAALVALASAFRQQGRSELARAVLEDTARLATGDATVWNGRGWVESGIGRPRQALEAWKKATELRSDLGEAQANYGRAAGEAGGFPAAVAALEVAVKVVPKRSSAWLDLGNAYLGARKFADAKRAYDRALSLDPGLADAYFDLGVLYLDGELEGMPTAVRLQDALASFEQFVGRGGSDPALEECRADARRLLAEEERRLHDQRAQTTGRAAAPADAPRGAIP